MNYSSHPKFNVSRKTWKIKRKIFHNNANWGYCQHFLTDNRTKVTIHKLNFLLHISVCYISNLIEEPERKILVIFISLYFIIEIMTKTINSGCMDLYIYLNIEFSLKLFIKSNFVNITTKPSIKSFIVFIN